MLPHCGPWDLLLRKRPRPVSHLLFKNRSRAGADSSRRRTKSVAWRQVEANASAFEGHHCRCAPRARNVQPVLQTIRATARNWRPRINGFPSTTDGFKYDAFALSIRSWGMSSGISIIFLEGRCRQFSRRSVSLSSLLAAASGPARMTNAAKSCCEFLHDALLLMGLIPD